MNGRTRTFRSGFTLIEILTVAALITLLVVMLLPALGKYRQIVKAHVTQTRINQLDQGCRMYANEFNPTDPVYPASSGYAGMQGSQLLVMFMTGIGYTPASPGTPPGFRVPGGDFRHGPYGGAENLPTAGSPPYFIDALNNPILYYCANPASGGYNGAHNDSPTPGPSSIDDYAKGFASGQYFRKDFLIISPGADGQWCDSGTLVSKSDDVTNLFMNR